MHTYEKVLLIAGLVVVGVTLAYRNLLDEEQKKDLREAADAVRAANDEVLDSVSPLVSGASHSRRDEEAAAEANRARTAAQWAEIGF